MSVDYAEISISIDKYVQTGKWTRVEIIKLLHDAYRNACENHIGQGKTDVKLLLSLRMEANRNTQKINAAMLNHPVVYDCLAGVDIVGDEACFSTAFYTPIFRDWQKAGKITVAHVGETGSRQNVLDAIVDMRVHRIRHGISVTDVDNSVLQLAKDLGICFDVSLHSNMGTGTTPDLYRHHLKTVLDFGCKATLGTDDPSVFSCTLDDEFKVAEAYGLLGSTPEEVAATTSRLQQCAINCSFKSLEGTKNNSINRGNAFFRLCERRIELGISGRGVAPRPVSSTGTKNN